MEQNEFEAFESDKNPNAPHPRKTQKLVGQTKAKGMFLDSYNSGKLHHAWLIHGPEGIGKATLAWKMVKFILSESPSQNIESQNNKALISGRINALSEPSILLCRRLFDKIKKKPFQEISIDQIRKINQFFSLSNTNSQWRIVIIDSINDLSHSAANALLKILEEPPEKGLFLLICKNKESILPTIKSRCRLVGCSFLNQTEFGNVLNGLESSSIQENDMSTLYALSQGSVGRALDIVANDGMKIFEKILKLINFKEDMERKKIWELLDQKADLITKKIHEDLIKRLILLALSRIATALIKKDINWHLPEEKVIIDFYKKYAESYLVFAWLYSLLVDDFRNAERINLDASNTLFSIFIKIETVLQKFRVTKTAKVNGNHE